MTRYVASATAILIVCLATLQGLFLALVPMVDYWRDDVEVILSDRLSASVSIGKLGAKSSWTGPYLEAVDVEIRRKEGSFNIDRVRVLFDLMRSLEALKPTIETLVLDAGELVSQQNSDIGYISPNLWSDLLDDVQLFLASLGELRVYNVDIVLDGASLTGLSIESTPEHGILAKTRVVTESGSFPIDFDWRFADVTGEHDLRLSTNIIDMQLPQLPQLPLPQIDHSVSLNGNFWITVSPNQPAKIQFAVSDDMAGDSPQIHATGDLLWKNANSEVKFDLLQMEYPGLRLSGEGSRAVFSESHVQLEPLKIQVDGNIFADYVDVSSTKPRINSLLSNNNPQVDLTDARIFWDFAHEFYLDGIMKSLSLDAFGGIPQLDPLKGQVVLTEIGGYIDFEAGSANFALPDIFENQWSDQKLKGIVAFGRIDSGLLIRGHDLVVADDNQSIRGNLLLDFPTNDEHLIQVELLADLNRRSLPGLMPRKLDDQIIDFLETSLLDVTVKKGRISYSGPIGRDVSRIRSDLSLRLPTESYLFKPLKKWPAFKGDSGLFELKEKRAFVALTDSEFGDLKVPHVTAHQSERNAGLIQVSGQIAGESAVMFDILEKAEAKPDAIGRDVLIDGSIHGHVRLQVPINGRPEGYVDLTTESLSFAIAGFNETIQQISGKGRYVLSKGFKSDNFKGELAGDPIFGRINVSDKTMQVELTGDLDIQNVLRYASINFAKESVFGRSDWICNIVREKGDLAISLETNGVGIRSQLPIPLTKEFDDVGRIVVNIDRVANAYKFSSEIFDNTQISGQLGTSPIAIEVVTPKVELGGWVNFSDIGSNSPSIAMLLRTKTLMLGETLLAINEAALNLRPNYMDMSFDGRDLAGRIERLGQGLLILELEHLNLPEGDDWLDPPDSDPLFDFNPGELPSIKIDISELHRGKTTYRNVHAKLVTGENRLDASDVRFSRDGQLFGGELSWVADELGSRSALTLRAEGPELGRFLRVNEDEPILEAKEGQFSANISWAGSPFGFSVLTSDGVVGLNLENGRFLDLGNSAEVLRLFGILNIETITRRLRLDFLDLIQPGVAFDAVDAQAALSDGILRFDPELVMAGPSSSFKLTGEANLRAKTLNQLLEVDIPLTNNLPLASVLLGAPQVGGAIYLVEKALGTKLLKVGKTDYRIEGAFDDPQVSLIPPFSIKKDSN